METIFIVQGNTTAWLYLLPLSFAAMPINIFQIKARLTRLCGALITGVESAAANTFKVSTRTIPTKLIFIAVMPIK